MTGYTDETFPAWYERLTDLERYDFDTDYATDDTDDCHNTDDTMPDQSPEQGSTTMTHYNSFKIHHSDCDQSYTLTMRLRNLGHAAYSPSPDLLLTSATADLAQSLTDRSVTETTLTVKNVSFDEPNAESNCAKAHGILESKGFYVHYINDTVLETDCPWYIIHRMYAVTEWVADEEEQD